MSRLEDLLRQKCDERLISVKEFAEITGIGRSTIYKLIREGKLVHYHIDSNIRLRLSDFREGGDE